jgi:hypothetical protein
MLSKNSLSKIVIIFFFIDVLKDILGSHTSGHTATDAFEHWWYYGLIFAVYYKLNQPKTVKKETLDHNAMMERLLVNPSRS